MSQRNLPRADLAPEAPLVAPDPSCDGPAVAHPRSVSRDPGVFVGRGRELEELQTGLEGIRSGRGRLFLVGGEAGIGKSGLADEFAMRAEALGFGVLWGRCWEAGGAPAYWPWVQCLRSYVREAEPEMLRALLGPDAPHLAHLLPELRELFPDLPAPPLLDSEAARFRLFDAATTFLRRAAGARPLVVVLDDLHAADVPSLLLLQFLAGELKQSPLVVVGLYRQDELGPDHPVASVLAELGREPATRTLLLGGLGPEDVARFIEISTGIPPHRGLVAALHGETEGNALFIGEIVRLLAHEGRLGEAVEGGSLRLNLPPGVREVIGRRKRHLSAECSRVLTLASVLGREFDLDALERLSRTSRDGLLRMLDEAESARVVIGVPAALGRMRFAHALIRDVFYEDVTAAARVRLHRRAGEALESLCADHLDPHLAELAHHFVEAAPGGEVEKAVAYARAAGDRAARLLAFEEAARLYRMALRALELRRSPAPELSCEILLSLGDAQMRANDVEGRETFVRAADLARGIRSPLHLARAALGHGGRFVWARSCLNPRTVLLLREALAAVGQDDSVLRTRLLARLAGALRDEPNGEERHALSREAVEIARRLGEPATLAYSLDGRYAATWEPGGAHERLAIATELTRVAESAADPERVVQGHHYRLVALLELGELPAAHAALEAKARVAEELRQPAQRWYVAVMRACLALFEGRLAEAEELMHAARALHDSGSWNAGVSFAVQLFALRREQGRLEEVEELIRRSVAEFTTFPMFRSILALLYAETGREAEARQVFETAAAADFADLPWDSEWLFGSTLLAEVACRLGDLPRAATLYRLIAPYARFNVVAPAEVSTGSAARSLGLLAATLSRWEEAERHFQDALGMNQRMGARPWAARTRFDLARMLLARDRPGDRGDARELLRQVLRSGESLGMTALSRQASSLLEGLEEGAVPSGRGAARSLADESGPRLQLHVFRREGEYWSVHYEGGTCRLKDSKGLRYIARLLAEPAREVHALDLVAGARPEVKPAEAGLRADGPGDAGEVLDARAKAEYRERIRELEEELEEARSWCDFARAERAEEERDFLVRELSRAVGLGGRDRRAGSAAERARISVTRAIKRGLGRIEEHHPVLGLHLASTIRTGAFCSYTPDPRLPVLWEI